MVVIRFHLQRSSCNDDAAKDATVYTDDAAAYLDIPFNHKVVKHSIKQNVDGKAHTDGIESFSAALKRAHSRTWRARFTR